MNYSRLFGKSDIINYEKERNSIPKHNPYILYMYDHRHIKRVRVSAKELYILGITEDIGGIYVEILFKRRFKFFMVSFTPYLYCYNSNICYYDGHNGIQLFFDTYPFIKKKFEYISSTIL